MITLRRKCPYCGKELTSISVTEEDFYEWIDVDEDEVGEYAEYKCTICRNKEYDDLLQLIDEEIIKKEEDEYYMN